MLNNNDENDNRKNKIKALAKILDELSDNTEIHYLTFFRKDLLNIKAELNESILSGNKENFDYLKGRYDATNEIITAISYDIMYQTYVGMCNDD